MIRKIQRYRDRKRYVAYLVVRDALKRQQQQERQTLAGRHELQAADVQRRLRALDRIEQRERQSLQQTARRERRQQINARYAHMPSPAPSQTSPEQEPAPAETRQRPDFALAREMAAAAGLLKHSGRRIDLASAFTHTSGDEEGSGEGTADSGGVRREAKRERKNARVPMPASPRIWARRYRRAG